MHPQIKPPPWTINKHLAIITTTTAAAERRPRVEHDCDIIVIFEAAAAAIKGSRTTYGDDFFLSRPISTDCCTRDTQQMAVAACSERGNKPSGGINSPFRLLP
jgi:hypothetical protein